MEWTVLFHPLFVGELLALPTKVQDELAAHAHLLKRFGPQLGRPWADTLKGSRYPNMKELRFQSSGGVWRVAYAFDPRRRAVLLICGNKTGVVELRFYRELIARADERFAAHLRQLAGRS